MRAQDLKQATVVWFMLTGSGRLYPRGDGRTKAFAPISLRSARMIPLLRLLLLLLLAAGRGWRALAKLRGRNLPPILFRSDETLIWAGLLLSALSFGLLLCYLWRQP